MEETILVPIKKGGSVMKLEIKQKQNYIKKRKVKTWSPAEDEKLIKLQELHPKQWGVIANLMNDRNENQCLHRHRRLSQQGQHKRIWSLEEDQTVLQHINKFGKNWKLISSIMGTKTGKQIRERFINKLDPQIRTEEWTRQQDRLILKLYSQLGSKWSQISKKIPGRPENKIKNRFYSYIKKNYDIKYTLVDSPKGMRNQESITQKDKKASKIKDNSKQYQKRKLISENKLQNQQISSLEQSEEDFHNQIQQDKGEMLEQNNQRSKFGLKQLMHVDQQREDSEQKYRDIRNIPFNNQTQNNLFSLFE